MTMVLFIILYAAAAVFALACVARVVMYARTPIHLRWELYPVPHEERERVQHGGSYFEQVDWWTKPTHFNLMGELKFMVPEMLFLKGLHEFNRKFWYRSFPFHFGLYLLIGTAGLLMVGTLGSLFAPSLMAGPFANILELVYTATGVTGLMLAILGALGLLSRRLNDRELKNFTTPGDIFNLLFFLLAFGLLSAGLLLRPASSPDMLSLSKALMTFDAGVEIPGLLAAGLILTGLLVAYIPLTHMSHFIAKYFTYHSVRWDDAPNRRGNRLEARLAEYLTYRPTWAATHIGADGKKTWAQVATSSPVEVKK